MAAYFGPQPVFSSCMHRHTQVIQNGGFHFTEGQVWDDIQENVLCIDCFKVLSEADVRAAWEGYFSDCSSVMEQPDGIP